MHGRHAQFVVAKRTFAYYLDDHHGDGIVGLIWKIARGENAAWVTHDPKRFYMPAYIVPRGWAGLRLDVGRVDWKEAASFLTDSYRAVAPKRLAALVAPAGAERGHRLSLRKTTREARK